tara:strand:- start:1241 stop:1720 length:480 start_codon:yes stop_codon:yes gene_type:complete
MTYQNLQEIETFLYLETSYLDQPDLDKWVNLFTEDGKYWMPASEAQQDPLNHVSHIYDDRVMMEIRRRNFVHPRSSSKNHLTRCSHIIGNIQISSGENPDEIDVTSNMHVIVWYREEQQIYAAKCKHILLKQNGEFKIRLKRVDLINPEAPQKSLVVYL